MNSSSFRDKLTQTPRWEEDEEFDYQSFDTPETDKKAVPTGQQSDSFTIFLSGILSAGMAGFLWILAYNLDIANTPWLAVVLAAAILIGVRFGGGKYDNHYQTGTAIMLYIVTLFVVVVILGYYQHNEIYTTSFGVTDLESYLSNHLTNFNNLIAYIAGAMTILVGGRLLETGTSR